MTKRLVVAAAGALLVAGAAAGGAAVLWGGGDDEAALQRIRISPAGGAGATAEAASVAAGDRMSILPYWQDEFVLVGELPSLDGPAPAWVARSASATAADAARLAALLGVTGEPVLQEWGDWTVGPVDGSGPSLTVSGMPLGDWWYSDPTLGARYACAEPVAPVPDQAGDAATSDLVVPDCPQPEPPTDLPSDDAARAEALRITDAAGGLLGDDVRVTRDEWGVNVERRTTLGGVETPFWTNVRFGGGGVVEYANGFLGSFEPAGDTPRIGTAEAFARLQAGRPFPWMGEVQGLARDVATADEPVSSADDGAAAGEVVAGEAGSGDAIEPAAGDEALPVDPAVPVEVRTIEIVGVEPTLWSVAGAEGELWLLPAYRFLSADGGQWDVVAVPDDLLQIVTPPVPEPMPLPEPAPLPAETAPAPGAPPSAPGEDPAAPPSDALDAVAAGYVALTEADALLKAEAEGRPVRVVQRDGVEQPVTADYLAERVNLVVTDGVVTDARMG